MDGAKIMKYFRKDNQVYAYDDEQISQGYGKDMTPMTDEEVELHINPPKTAEQLKAEAKAEALAYLASTDWYIVRFIDSGVEVPQEVKDKRAEARLLV